MVSDAIGLMDEGTKLVGILSMRDVVNWLMSAQRLRLTICYSITTGYLGLRNLAVYRCWVSLTKASQRRMGRHDGLVRDSLVRSRHHIRQINDSDRYSQVTPDTAEDKQQVPE